VQTLKPRNSANLCHWCYLTLITQYCFTVLVLLVCNTRHGGHLGWTSTKYCSLVSVYCLFNQHGRRVIISWFSTEVLIANQEHSSNWEASAIGKRNVYKHCYYGANLPTIFTVGFVTLVCSISHGRFLDGTLFEQWFTSHYAQPLVDAAYLFVTTWLKIPWDTNINETTAMLDDLTREANEECVVIVIQHGGHDVTCNPIICMGKDWIWHPCSPILFIVLRLLD